MALEYLGKAFEIVSTKLDDEHPNSKATLEWIMATLDAMEMLAPNEWTVIQNPTTQSGCLRRVAFF